ASRFINYPFETPIEVVTSIIGVPFFLYLIKRKGGDQRGA
ncbi:iron chelate uptake ABC transporter family permease subunit, partial [Staphylococcus aureus]|nr:iron chelate uptake ABC transporter family permease subunit [Staphylococcus aureus]